MKTSYFFQKAGVFMHKHQSFHGLFIVLIGVFCFLSLTGCGKNAAPPRNTVKADAKLPLAGQHYVFSGYDAFKPFRYIHVSSDGSQKVIGLDIAITDELSKRLGFTYEFKSMPFTSILASLQDKQSDFSAGFTSNPDREKLFDFTTSYFRPRVGVVATSKDPIHSINDLKGKTVACVTGSVQYTMANKLLKNKAHIVSFDSSDLCLQELLSHRIDAYLDDGAEAIEMVGPHPSLRANILSQKFSSKYLGDYHMMAWKGAPFTKYFNQELSQMKKDGTLNRLIKKWVGPQFVSNWKDGES